MDRPRATLLAVDQVVGQQFPILFDTCALVDLRKSPRDSQLCRTWLDDVRRSRRHVSIVARVEFLVGVTDAEARDRRAWLDGEFRVNRLGAATCSWLERLLKQGVVEPNGIPDAFIAATALENRHVLVSTDAFFESVPGLLLAKTHA